MFTLLSLHAAASRESILHMSDCPKFLSGDMYVALLTSAQKPTVPIVFFHGGFQKMLVRKHRRKLAFSTFRGRIVHCPRYF